MNSSESGHAVRSSDLRLPLRERRESGKRERVREREREQEWRERGEQ